MFLLLLSFFSLAAADAADSIVVWRLEPKSGVTDKESDALSAMVTTEVGRVSGRQTIGETDMKALMVGEEKKLSCGADDTACIAEIGAALGAPESVTGTVSKLGDYWIISLQRLNVRTVAVLGRAERKVKGDLNLLVESIGPMVAELFGKPVAEPTPAKRQETPATPPRELTILGWSGVGLLAGGGVLVIVGGIAHWQTGVAKKDYDAGKTGGDAGTYEAWKATTIAGYAVGGAAMAAGAALLIWDLMADRPVQAAVMPLPGGAMVSVAWRW
jgi:hypothetical protein